MILFLASALRWRRKHKRIFNRKLSSKWIINFNTYYPTSRSTRHQSSSDDSGPAVEEADAELSCSGLCIFWSWRREQILCLFENGTTYVWWIAAEWVSESSRQTQMQGSLWTWHKVSCYSENCDTGDKYQTLQYKFRVAQNTTSILLT